MSRTRDYSRKELESLRRADLQSLFKIHGLKGANQKSDALINVLLSHFSTATAPAAAAAAAAARPASPGDASNKRRLKSIDFQAVGRGAPDVTRRPPTAASNVTSKTRPSRPPSRVVTVPEAAEATPPIAPAAASFDLEERLRRLDESWAERQRKSEAESDEKLRAVQEKLDAVEAELKAVKAEMAARLASLPTHPAAARTAIAPDVIITDPSPLKRPEPRTTSYTPSSSTTGQHRSPARKKARLSDMSDDTAPEASPSSPMAPPIEPHTPMMGESSTMPADPHTPSPSHQGTSEDMSRTPGVGDGLTGLPYPVFSTTPRPREPHSPTLDAPPSASRQRAWSSNSLPKMLTPGRKRAEPAPRAVSQAHMDLTTITESDEAPVMRRHHTPPVAPLFPPSLSRDGTITPPRLSPSPSITESRFQHPSYPTKGSSLAPGPLGGAAGRGARQTSTPAREYMEVALHGLGNPSDSPSAQATPSHRTILGTERYRDTRFGDIPMMSWGSPGGVDFGPGTPQVGADRT